MSGAVQRSRATASPERGARVDLIVVAASFGGLAASREVLANLPDDLAAPLVLVQHRTARPDVLARILDRETRLAVVDAAAGVRPAAGTAYVAKPERELTIDPDGRFRYGDAGCGSPADALLISAAAVHGARLVAVILTGRLDDGARGAVAVKAAGGRVLVQDRASSAAFGMPAATIATGCVDFVLPPACIAAALTTLTMVPAAAELFAVGKPSWAATAA